MIFVLYFSLEKRLEPLPLEGNLPVPDLLEELLDPRALEVGAQVGGVFPQGDDVDLYEKGAKCIISPKKYLNRLYFTSVASFSVSPSLRKGSPEM